MSYEIVVVGTSLGGFGALKQLLGGLPAEFRLPVIVVQHQLEATDHRERSRLLGRYSVLPVREAEDKDPIQAGVVYLAPNGYHLLVERGSFALSTDEPVLRARPSIDVLFESAADAYGRDAIGVALTAASVDGARGLAAIKRSGGLVIVQDPASAESRVLPDAALALVRPDHVLRLPEIAQLLGRLPHRVAAAGRA